MTEPKLYMRKVAPGNAPQLAFILRQLRMLNQGFIVHGDIEVGWIIHSNLTLCEVCEHHTVEIRHVVETTEGA
jgi:hypothetical protein